MQHINDLTEPPAVGQTYLVDCIYTEYHEYVPILGPAHDDPVINVPYWHYHLDTRFTESDHSLTYFPGGPSRFHDQRKLQHWEKGRRATRPLVCIRPEPIYLLGNLAEFLYPHYQNQVATNNRCPHKGAYLGNLPVHGGCRTCPMHGLKWHAASGTAKKPPTRYKCLN